MSSTTRPTAHRLFEDPPTPSPATYQFVQSLLAFELSTFHIEDHGLICRAVEVVYRASGHKIVPRYEQLDCLVRLQHQDVIYVAATGSGKTLIIAMLLLLNPKLFALIVSPLKELQRGQARDLEKLGIRSLAFMKETPRSASFWEPIFTGLVQSFIVQPEALLKRDGRLMELFDLPLIESRLGIWVVDEAHFIDTWGRAHGDRPAFQPAWAELGASRSRLFPNTRVLAMSATVSESQSTIIRDSLRLSDMLSILIRRNLNRSNICYAIRPLVDSKKHLPNYDFLVPVPDKEPESTIVFCDDRKLTITISNYLQHRLCPAFQAKRLILPYHSGLCDDTRRENWQEYLSGSCRILVATSSAGTGCNAAITRNVVQVGLCWEFSDLVQRSGRIRSLNGIALLLFEPWAIAPKVEREKWCNLAPKKEFKALPGLQKNMSRKRLREVISKRSAISPLLLDYVNLENDAALTGISWCRGNFLNQQNGAPDARSVNDGWHCCDGPNCGLPGGKTASELFYVQEQVKAAGVRKKYRSPAQRNTLRPQLLAWRSRVHKAAGFGNIVQVEVFLPDTVINSLVKVAPKASESVVHEALLCLDLEKEWLKEVFGIIHAFDHGGWEALHTATTTATTSRNPDASLMIDNHQT